MTQTVHTPTTRSRGFALLALGGATLIAAAGFALATPASPAHAHDELVSIDVTTNDSGAPEAIEMSFSNSIIEVGTEVTVTDADGAEVTDGEPEIAGPNVTQPLLADLPAGDYDGAWRVVSSDGHPIDGAFTVSYDEGGEATLAQAAGDDHHDDAADDDADGASGDAASDTTDNAASPGLAVPTMLAVGGGIVLILAIVLVIVQVRRKSAGPGAGEQK